MKQRCRYINRRSAADPQFRSCVWCLAVYKGRTLSLSGWLGLVLIGLNCDARPCQVWSRKTYSLPSYSVFTLRYDVTLTFDPVTLTIDLDYWTCVVYRLWPSETLYKIRVKLSNPQQSYCDWNVLGLPYYLEHVSRDILFCGIIFTKRKSSWPILGEI